MLIKKAEVVASGVLFQTASARGDAILNEPSCQWRPAEVAKSTRPQVNPGAPCRVVGQPCCTKSLLWTMSA